MDKESIPLTILLADDLDRFFEQLVLMYQGQLYALALSRTHRPEMAEEIVQTAFIRAYYALKDYPSQRIRTLKLEAWLYEITRNALYNYLRQISIRATKLPSLTLNQTDDDNFYEFEDSSLSPDEEVCRQESQKELEKHIASLPDTYRETIQLYYLEDLSYQQIAKRYHQPIGTVKANVHRGTKLLRRTLEISQK